MTPVARYASSITERVFEGIEPSGLGRIDTLSRRGKSEPFGAINLWKAPTFARMRRPFHLELIAFDCRRIEIAADRPGEDRFAAGLTTRRQGAEFAGDHGSRFFGEFAYCCLERFLARLYLAFGDGPGAFVLLCPVRAAGMDEKNFERAFSYAVEQQPCALFCHQLGPGNE